mmetsp:Transcript_6094/g.24288  ORF Transcript_6094/g.24288 Transcript_6094/m.24288 type:complete len:221 (-) Transcript_6094:4691-5353(-)
MKADAYLERSKLWRIHVDERALGSLHGGEGKARHTRDMCVGLLAMHRAGAHEAVANRFELEEVELGAEAIEGAIQSVEKVRDLLRLQSRAQLREPDDVREEDGHVGVPQRSHLLTAREARSHVGWEHALEEVCAALVGLGVEHIAARRLQLRQHGVALLKGRPARVVVEQAVLDELPKLRRGVRAHARSYGRAELRFGRAHGQQHLTRAHARASAFLADA